MFRSGATWFVLAFGTDEDALQFDIDGSGEFDFFDWIEFIDWCD